METNEKLEPAGLKTYDFTGSAQPRSMASSGITSSAVLRRLGSVGSLLQAEPSPPSQSELDRYNVSLGDLVLLAEHNYYAIAPASATAHSAGLTTSHSARHLPVGVAGSTTTNTQQLTALEPVELKPAHALTVDRDANRQSTAQPQLTSRGSQRAAELRGNGRVQHVGQSAELRHVRKIAEIRSRHTLPASAQVEPTGSFDPGSVDLRAMYNQLEGSTRMEGRYQGGLLGSAASGSGDGVTIRQSSPSVASAVMPRLTPLRIRADLHQHASRGESNPLTSPAASEMMASPAFYKREARPSGPPVATTDATDSLLSPSSSSILSPAGPVGALRRGAAGKMPHSFAASGGQTRSATNLQAATLITVNAFKGEVSFASESQASLQFRAVSKALSKTQRQPQTLMPLPSAAVADAARTAAQERLAARDAARASRRAAQARIEGLRSAFSNADVKASQKNLKLEFGGVILDSGGPGTTNLIPQQGQQHKNPQGVPLGSLRRSATLSQPLGSAGGGSPSSHGRPAAAGSAVAVSADAGHLLQASGRRRSAFSPRDSVGAGNAWLPASGGAKAGHTAPSLAVAATATSVHAHAHSHGHSYAHGHAGSSTTSGSIISPTSARSQSHNSPGSAVRDRHSSMGQPSEAHFPLPLPGAVHQTGQLEGQPSSRHVHAVTWQGERERAATGSSAAASAPGTQVTPPLAHAATVSLPTQPKTGAGTVASSTTASDRSGSRRGPDLTRSGGSRRQLTRTRSSSGSHRSRASRSPRDRDLFKDQQERVMSPRPVPKAKGREHSGRLKGSASVNSGLTASGVIREWASEGDDDDEEVHPAVPEPVLLGPDGKPLNPVQRQEHVAATYQSAAEALQVPSGPLRVTINGKTLVADDLLAPGVAVRALQDMQRQYDEVFGRPITTRPSVMTAADVRHTGDTGSQPTSSSPPSSTKASASAQPRSSPMNAQAMVKQPSAQHTASHFSFSNTVRQGKPVDGAALSNKETTSTATLAYSGPARHVQLFDSPFVRPSRARVPTTTTVQGDASSSATSSTGLTDAEAAVTSYYEWRLERLRAAGYVKKPAPQEARPKLGALLRSYSTRRVEEAGASSESAGSTARGSETARPELDL